MQYFYKVGILYTLILFLDRIDLTILNVAMPTLAKTFGVNSLYLEWISLSFLIGLSIAISISAWLGERFGYKEIFILSVAGFGIFSLFCALSNSFEMFVLYRFIQGFFGGIIIPSGNAILYMSCEKKDYAKVTTFVFMPTLIAPAIAPYLGGTILKYFSYKFIFFINVPICLLICVASWIILRKHTPDDNNKFDFIGFALSGLFYISFFCSVSLVSQGRLNYALVIGIVAVILFLCFVGFELRSSTPIVNIRYLYLPTFRSATLVQMFFQMSHFGSLLILNLYFQSGLGFSPQHTGMILAFQPIGSIIVGLPSRYVFDKIGAIVPVVFGLIGVGLITPAMLLIVDNSDASFYLAICLSLARGLCSGWVGKIIQSVSLYDAASSIDIGRMSSMFSIARQLSIGLGICFGMLVLNLNNLFYGFDYLNHILPRHDVVQLFTPNFIAIALFCLAGSICAFGMDNKGIKAKM